MHEPNPNTATKLRDEIQSAKKYRYDFVLRKFAFGTALLGIGSLSGKLTKEVTVAFSSLLYLVPLVAIAFDIYILTEDYRIKRAGEFIKSELCKSRSSEREWEEFARL